MNLKKLHNTLLFIMIWSFSYAQQYTNFTTKDGLPSNHIYKVTQDFEGFIWILTSKGLVKYNGKTFKVFTTKDGLPTNDIWDIRITNDNKKWFFTKANKLGYIENETVYTFSSDDDKKILYPISISQTNNNVFFSDIENTYFLEENSWQKYKHKVKIENGAIPILTNKTSYFLNINTLENYIPLLDKEYRIIKNLKKEIFIQNVYKGQLNDSLFYFLGNKEYGIIDLKNLNILDFNLKRESKYVRINQANNKIQLTGLHFNAEMKSDYSLENYFFLPEALNSHYTFKDINGNYWIATFSNGLYFLSKNKRNVKTNFSNKKVGEIKKIGDKLWVNVFEKGVYEIDSITLESKPTYLTNDFVFNFKEIKELNKTYIFSKKETFTFNEKSNHVFTLEYQGFENVRNLVYHTNYLYGFSSSSLYKIDKDNYKIIHYEKEFGIRQLFNLNNTIYAATASGLKILENDKLIKVPNLNFDKPIISTLPIHDKKLIIGTDGFGAYLLHNNKIQLIDQTDFLSVQDCFLKEGVLWLATNNGILRFEEGNETWRLVKKYTTANGLPSNLIHQIYITEKNIIATSNNGVTSIPIHTTNNTNALGVYIEKHSYNNKSTNTSNIYESPSQIDFKVAEINFNPTKDISYQYQLLPIHKKWFTSTSTHLSFNNLAPNKYTLQIKSNANTTFYSFEIKPLWFQTMLAKIAFWSFGLVSFLGIVLRIRKKELKKQSLRLNSQKKLAEFELYALRSQMNPHFVFNSLNAIQYYLNDNKIELSEKYLVKFSKLIRMFFDFSEHKVISIKEEVQLLDGYLEIEKLRFGDDFNYAIQLDQNLNEECLIPAMLLQPIVENAVNHGLFHNFGKGLIKILFQKITTTIYEVIIEDNGVGREKSKEIKKKSLNKHQSKSTQILQERIALLNQSKEWDISYKITDLDDENHSGTRVYLKFNRL